MILPSFPFLQFSQQKMDTDNSGDAIIKQKARDAVDIDFEEIGEDLLALKEDEMVQAALHRGVDLKKYGRELEKELRLVSELK